MYPSFRKIFYIIFTLIIFSLLFTTCGNKQDSQTAKTKKYTIATVVKVDGLAWFERMRTGVDKFAEDTGNECFLLGPQKSDAALQVQIIEDLIAQGVDAICVVPFAVEALEPVLKKARNAGIVVVSHEASTLVNTDLSIEAFDNYAYGAHLMDHLARYMNYEGEFAVTVGSLTSKSHNEWVDGAMARQKEKYPDLKLVTGRIEDYDDQNVAYQKIKELLIAYPNLKGIQGSASTTVGGGGLALEEKGLQDRIMLVGTGLVSVTRQYLDSGSVKLISFWDPADAGYVMNKLAVMLLEGQQVTNGLDLGVPGYDNIQQDKDKANLFYGAAWVDVTKENMDEFDF